MKVRHTILFLASAALFAAGCGSDSEESKKKDDKPKTKAEKRMVADREVKEENVDRAKKDFDKAKDDVGACRNLAMSYIALASPASPTDPKEPVELPEDREESLDKAVGTLEDCQEIDTKDRDVKQMLSSTYMATQQYDKASVLLKQLATSAKGPERANAHYAWGLAASNAEDYTSAIQAWETFIELSDPKDPRIAQVRQSIKALRAAKDKPATPAPAASEDDGESKDAEESDEG